MIEQQLTEALKDSLKTTKELLLAKGASQEETDAKFAKMKKEMLEAFPNKTALTEALFEEVVEEQPATTYTVGFTVECTYDTETDGVEISFETNAPEEEVPAKVAKHFNELQENAHKAIKNS